MAGDVANEVLKIIVEVFSIAGSILAVGAWIGKKFDKVQDKFDKLCEDLKGIQIDAQKHVTFQHCHAKRENCPIAQDLKLLRKDLKKRGRK